MLVFDIVCSLLIPVAYIVVGLIFWKGGPFKRNDMAGWRTKLAMRSQETWNFANTYGGRAFFILGIGTLSVTIILMFLLSGAKQSLKDLMTVVFVVMQTLLLIPCYRKVENEIKKDFILTSNTNIDLFTLSCYTSSITTITKFKGGGKH